MEDICCLSIFTSKLKIFLLCTSEKNCGLEMCTPPIKPYQKYMFVSVNHKIKMHIKYNRCMTSILVKENVQIWSASVVFLNN
jgi:hypothetical protein